MVFLTPNAHARLRQLLEEHPEEHVVRIEVHEVDERRLGLNITLEEAPQPEDHVEDLNGLTLAVAGPSLDRLDGATLDYNDVDGFRLQHPTPPAKELRVISLN
ncbi:hypothetical protein [Candidatus Nitrospira bockiana]